MSARAGAYGIDVPIERRAVRSEDGTWLRAFVCGTGPHRWLLPPGLGTPLLAWKRLVEHFGDRMTIVTWDPRACHGSSVPSDPQRIEVDDHVADALAVAAAVGWEDDDYLTGGWSMAVQIGLELAARRPVRALALIAGTYEHVLETAFRLPGSGRALAATVHGMALAGRWLTPAARRVARQRWLLDALRRLGLIAASDRHFAEVVEQFSGLDLTSYMPMILALNRHSARDLLPRIRVPTLVIAGGADLMTPLEVSRELASAVQGAELAIVPRGTHYTTLEFPAEVHGRLERFFRERVWPESW